MRVLVTFALPTEFAFWRKRHRFSKMRALAGGRDLARCPLFRTWVGECEVVVALTGMGPVQARRATRYALQCAPDVCISSGLAGAVKDAYRPGDVLAATQVSEIKGKRFFLCEASLVEHATACGARRVERFLTSPTVVVTAAAKRALAGQGDAVEMESASVLAAASAVNIPAIAIRAVSDAAGQDLPLDLNRVFSAKGSVRPVRLLGSLAAEPASLPGLLRLAGATRRAATGLAEFLDRYITALAENGFGRQLVASGRGAEME
jgi:adenosylhomocysteine nucleosidase